MSITEINTNGFEAYNIETFKYNFWLHSDNVEGAQRISTVQPSRLPLNITVGIGDKLNRGGTYADPIPNSDMTAYLAGSATLFGAQYDLTNGLHMIFPGVDALLKVIPVHNQTAMMNMLKERFEHFAKGDPVKKFEETRDINRNTKIGNQLSGFNFQIMTFLKPNSREATIYVGGAYEHSHSVQDSDTPVRFRRRSANSPYSVPRLLASGGVYLAMDLGVDENPDAKVPVEIESIYPVLRVEIGYERGLGDGRLQNEAFIYADITLDFDLLRLFEDEEGSSQILFPLPGSDEMLDITDFSGVLPDDFVKDIPQLKNEGDDAKYFASGVPQVLTLDVEDIGEKLQTALEPYIPAGIEQYQGELETAMETAEVVLPHVDEAVAVTRGVVAGAQTMRAGGTGAQILNAAGRATIIGAVLTEAGMDFVEDRYLSEAGLEEMRTGQPASPVTKTYSTIKDMITPDQLGMIDMILDPKSVARLVDKSVQDGEIDYTIALEAIDRLALEPDLADEAAEIVENSVGLRYLKALENFAVENGFPDGVHGANVSEIAEALIDCNLGDPAQLQTIRDELEARFGLIRLPESGEGGQWWISGAEVKQGENAPLADQYLPVVDFVADLWRDKQDQASTQAKRGHRTITEYGSDLGVNIQPTIFDTYTGPNNKPKGPVAEKR